MTTLQERLDDIAERARSDDKRVALREIVKLLPIALRDEEVDEFLIYDATQSLARLMTGKHLHVLAVAMTHLRAYKPRPKAPTEES